MTGGAADDREQLVETTLPYVRRLAARIARELPRAVALDDLVAAGRVGLLDAAGRYDPARGARFTTYAHYRIRGAILDHVRDAFGDDPLLRARYAAEAAVDDAVERRVTEGPATDTADDAAGALADALGDMAAAFTLAEIAARTAPDAPADPETSAVDAERSQHVATAMESLPDAERAMLRAVYFEGQSLERAGAAMGLSKSWASRLHARALAKLRGRLGVVGPHL